MHQQQNVASDLNPMTMVTHASVSEENSASASLSFEQNQPSSFLSPALTGQGHSKAEVAAAKAAATSSAKKTIGQASGNYPIAGQGLDYAIGGGVDGVESTGILSDGSLRFKAYIFSSQVSGGGEKSNRKSDSEKDGGGGQLKALLENGLAQAQAKVD